MKRTPALEPARPINELIDAAFGKKPLKKFEQQLIAGYARALSANCANLEKSIKDIIEARDKRECLLKGELDALVAKLELHSTLAGEINKAAIHRADRTGAGVSEITWHRSANLLRVLIFKQFSENVCAAAPVRLPSNNGAAR